MIKIVIDSFIYNKLPYSTIFRIIVLPFLPCIGGDYARATNAYV